jgi:hypothetical protein
MLLSLLWFLGALYKEACVTHTQQNGVDEVNLNIIKCKKEVKLSPCLSNYTPRQEDVCGSGCIDPRFTSAVVGGEWSASRTGLLTPGERTAGTRWVGFSVGPRAGLSYMEK